MLRYMGRGSFGTIFALGSFLSLKQESERIAQRSGMSTLHFNVEVDGIEKNTFVVHQFSGQESLSDDINQLGASCVGYRYNIDLASRRHDIAPEDLVDRTAQLELYRDGTLERVVHGVVRCCTLGDTGHHHTFYSITLVPSLERLSLRQNSRIFQGVSVPEILSILLQEMGILDYAFSLKYQHQKRDYCVQYRETDLVFLHRLMAEEGMVYSFSHQVTKHTILFTDSNRGLEQLSQPVDYNPNSGSSEGSAYISQLLETHQVTPSDALLQEYSFKKPEHRFMQNAANNDGQSYEHFLFPGRYHNQESGKIRTQSQLEFLQRSQHIGQVSSNEMKLRAGLCFSLTGEQGQEVTKDWQVVALSITATQPQALEEEGGVGTTTYRNEALLIPSSNAWKRAPSNKPVADGATIAVVVGPENEEIYTDEYGRVKLHFPWDRYSNGNELSSCWVRVAQSSAGSQYGVMAIPRVGHEVIVSFINGDPDQPLITGRTHNANNPPSYSLPKHKTKTVIRSESYQGSGFNELSFEDSSGAEQVYMHAQKDLKAQVNNDHTTHIHHDEHLLVGNDQFTQVKRDAHVKALSDSRTTIKARLSEQISGSLNQNITNKFCAKSGREMTLQSGAKLVVEAGAEVTLKAGGSFVKVDGSGVHLVGAAINLNAGGSAGSGTQYSGVMAALPNGVTPPQDPDVKKAVRHQALLIAEESHIPLVKPCPLEEE